MIKYESKFLGYAQNEDCDSCNCGIYEDDLIFTLEMKNKTVTLCEKCKEELHKEIKIMLYREELESR